MFLLLSGGRWRSHWQWFIVSSIDSITLARGQVFSCRRRRFWSVFKQLSTPSIRKKRLTRRKFTKVSKQRHMHNGAVNICVNITNCIRLWIYFTFVHHSCIVVVYIYSQLRASYLIKLSAYPWPSEISFFWQCQIFYIVNTHVQHPSQSIHVSNVSH